MPLPSVSSTISSVKRSLILHRLCRHVFETLRLAPGIVLARSGIVIMILVDTIIVGRYSSTELGYFAIGNSIVQPIIVTSLGLILGTLVLTASNYGAGRLQECGSVWRRSVIYSVVLGLFGLLICLFGESILIFSGQSRDLSAGGARVIMVIGLGIPPHLVFLACSFFLEGLGRVGPGAICMILANVLNLILGILLVGGSDWITPLGAEGAAWATTISRWFLAVIMVGCVILMKDQALFSLRSFFSLGRFSEWGHQRRLGYAMGLSLAVETLAFSIMQQFAGWLGTSELAAFAIAFQLLTISFMVAIGIGAATAVRVGIAFGRGNSKEIALAGWTGLGLSVFANALIGMFILVFAEPITGVFTEDTAVLAFAIPLLFWVAVALVTDGGQAVVANALRGRQDVWVACSIQGIVFLGIMVPLTWVLSYPLELGAIGLFQGVLIAATLSVLLLGLRFQQLYIKGK